MLSASERAAVEAISPGPVVDTLGELIVYASVGGTAPEAAVQHRLAERLDGLGLTVDLWPLELAGLRAAADYPGEEVERDRAWGLVAQHRPDEAPELILQAHIDVVPTGDPGAWLADPFRAATVDLPGVGPSITGRGACDMKGGLASILAAVAAVLRGAGDVPPFAVHCVVGEEDGGLGAYATLTRGHTGRACIIPEPTGLRLVTGNAGSLTFRLEVPGLASHGSTRYAGSSALDSYVGLHTALADLERRRNADREELMAGYPIPYPLSVGRVRAGDWPSSVPDRLVAEGRYGLRIAEDPGTARAEFAAAIAEAAGRDAYLRDHPPVLSWPGGRFAGGRLPAGDPLRGLVGQAHAAVAGEEVGDEQGAPWGSDLRLYAAAGVPTLHYGPGDVRLAHGPRESVPVAELVTAARVLAVALLRSARPGSPVR